jgi:hypothetical protein
MQRHRVSLTDAEAQLIVSALYARLAMRKGKAREETLRLLRRLDDIGPGNPDMRFLKGPK